MRFRTSFHLSIPLLVVLAACTASTDDVHGVHVRYRTASIPPPHAYAWEIDARFGETLTFRRMFLYRSEEQEGDSNLPQDLELTIPMDSTWESRLFGAAQSVHRFRLRRDEPGSDSMEATYLSPHGEIAGRPTNPDAWHEIARDLLALAGGEPSSRPSASG